MNKKIKITITSLTIFTLILAGVWYFLTYQPNVPIENNKKKQEAVERRESDNHKKHILAQQNEKNTANEQPDIDRNGSIVISHNEAEGNTLRVSSYISNRVEEGGECTIVVSDGKRQITKTRPSVMNASTTSCGYVEINIQELDNNLKNTFYVEYKKNTYNARSELVEVIR